MAGTTGKTGVGTDRYHIDAVTITVDDHDLVLHDEKAIVPICGENID